MIKVVKFYNEGDSASANLTTFLVKNDIDHESVSLVNDKKIFEKFSVEDVPTVIIFDTDGTEVHRVVGFNSVKIGELKNAIKIASTPQEVDNKPKW